MNLREAKKMAVELMADHLLVGWRFDWDRAVSRFGCCHWSKRTITLSRHLVRLNDEARVRMTIIHEIAHAKAGAAAGHGDSWRAIALSLGHTGERCYSATNTVAPPRRYRGSCHNCFHSYEAHKRSRVACGRCCKNFSGGKFDERYLIHWEVIR